MTRRLVALAILMLTVSVAFAQNRDGTFRIDEADFTFDVVITGTANGQLTGSLSGIQGDIPFTQLQMQPDGSLRGVFPIEGYMAGFVGNYHDDLNSMDIYLYTLNDAGVPLAGSEERYVGTRVSSFLDAAAPEPEPEVEPEPTGPSFGDLLGTPTADDGGSDFVAATAGTQPDLAGNWRGETYRGDVHLAVKMRLGTDGTYVEEGLINGESAGQITGTYTFSNGTLTLYIEEHPEQICIGGECQPFVAESPTTYTLSAVTTDSFTMTSPDDPNLNVNMLRDTGN